MALEIQSNERPWQIEQFQRSLKKQLKLEALLELEGNVDGQDCLLISCGDNNGALNWYFREHGGNWIWADVEGNNLAEMGALLGDEVNHISESSFPFADNLFDCVVAIDVLEHLQDDQPFLHEVRRVLRPDGRAIVTVPNGDPRLLANRIKWRVGMTPEVYGHTRAGYTIAELQDSIEKVGLTPVDKGGYSRFFTEMVELLINYGYVFVLSRKKAEQGHIAPTTSGELKTHGAAYRLYSLLYPVMKLISRMDSLLPAENNNAVIVTAVKSEPAA
ncbi:MAG: methyltransferase domain-containing protein [Chloroflexi bacterium]|jgi:ubiquinone/menaquinone biosynthesis C-methylase UbiE|nr:methyltransferase domain-containing protein [Chloroflexota bacterium]